MLVGLRKPKILLNSAVLQGPENLKLEIELYKIYWQHKLEMLNEDTKGFRNSRAKRSLQTHVIKVVFTDAGADPKR